MVLKLCQE